MATAQLQSELKKSPYEELCSANGWKFDAIDKARKDAALQLQQIHELLTSNQIDVGDTLSVVVFGSLARGEVTSGSDIDWTLLVDGPVDPTHYKTAARIREILLEAKLAEPATTGTFGTISSSHDIAHHIGGLEDSNRNMTRRLLLLLESVSPLGDDVRKRVIRAVLDRYIVWGAGLPGESNPKLRVPRFLLNDVVRYWRTMAVDYAAKKWEQLDKKWAIRNSKLRVTRKMTFVKGLLLCFDCEIFTDTEPWVKPVAGIQSWDEAERRLASGMNSIVELTPIDVLSRLLLRLNMPELAMRLLRSYNEFLSLIDQEVARDELENLKFGDAQTNATFRKVRNEIGKEFGEALDDLFLGSAEQLSQLTKKYGLF
jgi:predicted nucleotidyltransferase